MLPVALFPCIQRHLFFDKVPETVSDMLVGTYGKEYTFYQLCFPYPLVAFAGCGNRQHSGHCCSEIAFTDLSTRTDCIQLREPGAPHCRIVHRDGQCTISLVLTQRAKERFYCKVWQVLFTDSLSVSPVCPVSIFTRRVPVAAISLRMYYFIHFMTSLLMIDTQWYFSYYTLSLSPSLFIIIYSVTMPTLYH